MKIIFTTEDKKTVRKTVDGFRQSYVIDARDIILKIDYLETSIINNAQDFIINKELEKKLSQALINKKSHQVIYFHYTLTAAFIKNIKTFFKNAGVSPEYAIFDPTKEYKKIWKMFDEVL